MSLSASRLEQFRAIEKEVSKLWAELKPFEEDAPATTNGPKEKVFITFPYPYMNGLLHLGHAFSLTKAEFAAGYFRMQGKQVLWPFGLHATGLPIAACAKKLQNEIRQFGNPPVFPKEPTEGNEAVAGAATANQGTFHSKKGKKAPSSKTQWEIMEQMKVEHIDRFQDPYYWLKVFPEMAVEDLKLFGCRIDFRRSFITTDMNPYYDSFVRWQFIRLREGKHVAFGKRNTIFSPLDNQPCQDHDRRSGEGILPIEYTIVKIRVIDPTTRSCFDAYKEIIGSKSIVLPAATLRPETMVGQTNCWVSPKITYYAYEVDSCEIFLMTKRSARNLSFQDHTVSDVLFEISGKALLGLSLKAPLCPYERIFVLPMDTISENKGTGIVSSVPSDSPDDYINFTYLKEKADVREKAGVKEEWVAPIAMIPILEIKDSELGTNSAEVACAIHKVKGPKDADALDAAKKMTYKEGFYRGVMTCGPYSGIRVEEAKALTRALLISNNDALAYCEPDGTVVSRSGDECVVALVDQWYLKYGDPEWKRAVEAHVEKMETYNPSVKNGLQETISWLREWACSRTFGLGTSLPYENTSHYLIDSLSDSTIYMAYYTVAHILHGMDNLDGSSPSKKYNVPASAMTPIVWDYIFFGGELPKDSGICEETLTTMRREFSYWYPVDLRVSGKDLIQNHLTMCLYNHAAIWKNDPSLWPQSYFCNGHILIDKEKMSKSVGNFRTLRETVEEFTVDGTRLALADSGDSLDDPNFVTGNAVAFANKLGSLIDFCQEQCQKIKEKVTLRPTDASFTLFDKIFQNEINTAIVAAESAYSKMLFRHAIHAAFFELTNARDEWKVHCSSVGLHSALLLQYIEVQCRLLYPICPHVTEHIFCMILPHYDGKPQSLSCPGVQWPKASPIDPTLRLIRKLVLETLNNIRGQHQKASKKQPKLNAVTIFAAAGYSEWQKKALMLAQEANQTNSNNKEEDFFVTGHVAQALAPKFKADAIVAPKIADALSFMAYVRDNNIPHNLKDLKPLVNDFEVLTSLQSTLSELCGLQHVIIRSPESVTAEESSESIAAKKSRTSQPSIYLSEKN